MFTRIQQIYNVNDLREYINITLCEHYQLQFGAFQMTEQDVNTGRKTMWDVLLS